MGINFCLNINYHYNFKGRYYTTFNKIKILQYHQYQKKDDIEIKC